MSECSSPPRRPSAAAGHRLNPESAGAQSVSDLSDVAAATPPPTHPFHLPL